MNTIMSSYSPQSLLNAADEKFKSNNVEEALTLANMAKQVDPQFEGVDNFVASYAVHVAASRNKFNGGVDWYGVLGIGGPTSDIEIVKKHYKKLALMVHPDKNSSIAAEGAFKMVSQAWKVVSSEARAQPYRNVWNSSWPSMWARKPTPEPAWFTRPVPPFSSAFGGRECLKCKRWCNYQNKNQSSMHCSHCNRKFVFRSS